MAIIIMMTVVMSRAVVDEEGSRGKIPKDGAGKGDLPKGKHEIV